MVRASCILNQWYTVVEDRGMASDGPAEDGTTAVVPPMGQDLDEPVFGEKEC